MKRPLDDLLRDAREGPEPPETPVPEMPAGFPGRVQAMLHNPRTNGGREDVLWLRSCLAGACASVLIGALFHWQSLNRESEEVARVWMEMEWIEEN